ncbi:alpha/beta hydrolase fold domain-containing protein [Streptomyces sp. NPDC057099]|uniref:alpha/beta hydrolase fold domain-containing protein n=1 Tax=Streptomyces sp. NPDC057099 TaxID=3346019 RepID=UPI0036320FDD
MSAASPVVLEPAGQDVAEGFSTPPADARKVLADAQSAPIGKLPVDEEWITVPAHVGDVRVRLIKPQGGLLPIIVYMHGGGWILGNAETHDRLVRELAVGVGGTIHDFMLLTALSETRATRAAIGQATAFLRTGLGTR